MFAGLKAKFAMVTLFVATGALAVLSVAAIFIWWSWLAVGWVGFEVLRVAK
jgi:hypothetical protein